MIAAATALAAAGLFGAHVALPQAVKMRQKVALRRACQGSVVLTYDDGPGPGLTGELIDLLDERDAKATFFILGRAIPGGEAVLDRLVEEGHELASHSQQHLHAWKTMPLAQLKDLALGLCAAERWTDNRPMIRPPYGKWTLPAMLWMHARGNRAAWWTIDSGDTHDPRPSAEHAAGLVDSQGGGVVLLHDFDQSEEHRRFVLDATAAILDVAARRGMPVRTMGDVLEEAHRG